MILRSLVFPLALLVVARQAKAQLVLPERARGEVGLRGGAERQATGTVFTPEQWFRLALDGVLREPGLARFALSLAPSWSQAKGVGASAATVDQSGAWLGLDGSLHVFPLSPLNGYFTATRSRTRDRNSFGLDRRTRQSGLGGTLRFQNLYFPLELSAKREARAEDLLTGGATEYRASGALTTFHVGLENRKTRILLERWAFDDRTLNLRTATNLATLQHLGRWGKGSSLQTQLNYRSDGGGSRSTQLQWSERAHLQHRRSVYSDGGYQYVRSTVLNSATTQRFADWSLASQLSSSLHVALGLNSQAVRFPGGKADGMGVAPGIGLGVRLPRGAAFSASASFAYQRFVSESDAGLWLNAVGEQHIVDETGRVTLSNPRADPASLSVTDPHQTRIFVLGLDYDAVPSGPFLELVVLPGGRIVAGDTLLVGYRYQGEPRAEGHSVGASLGASLSVPHLRVYHRRTIRRPSGTVPAGELPLRFGSRDEAVVGLASRLSTPVGAVDATAEWNRLDIPAYYSTSTTLNLTWRMVLPHGSEGALGFAGSRSDGTGGRQEVERGTTSFAASPFPGLSLRTDIGGWRWAREGAASSYLIGGGVDVSWRVGLTQFTAHYSRNWWGAETTRARDLLTISAVRTF